VMRIPKAKSAAVATLAVGSPWLSRASGRQLGSLHFRAFGDTGSLRLRTPRRRHGTKAIGSTASCHATLRADEECKIHPAEKLGPAQRRGLVLVVANIWIGSGIQQQMRDF
jgi:hypothetical protein